MPAHSGVVTGIVPDSFNVLRQLLSRIENAETGEFCLQTDIPKDCEEGLDASAKVLGDQYFWEEGVGPRKLPIVEHLKNQMWRAGMCVTGADELPSIASAGNVLRTHTTLKISIRLPPSIDAEEGFEQLKAILTKDPPFGAKIEVIATLTAKGWYARGYPPKFKEALKAVPKECFGEEYCSLAGGGSIPFVTILDKYYPNAIIIITGAAGADSNCRAPNEFLGLGYTKKFIAAMTKLITTL
eukprot:TRINITY_DN555_c0_g1_i2.p1 TRINITY_DN555_c0_g1~~TRINITY_DN555_c0_g1_i2.p1  ORF type:complete len:241 (+),score=41.70 TRINITY_DN555_c0_g1_i2:673-1395(+)